MVTRRSSNKLYCVSIRIFTPVDRRDGRLVLNCFALGLVTDGCVPSNTQHIAKAVSKSKRAHVVMLNDACAPQLFASRQIQRISQPRSGGSTHDFRIERRALTSTDHAASSFISA